MELNRRSFLSATAAAAVAAGAATALAEPQEMSPVLDIAPDNNLDLFQTSTSLEAMNKARRAMIDSVTEDYVCADGTVIPAIWMKVRMTIDSLGRGVGGFDATYSAAVVEAWKRMCNNDETIAQVFVNLPLGMRFTITDAVVSTGMDEETVRAALDAMTYNGLIFHTQTMGCDWWNLQHTAHGILEACQNLYDEPGFILNLLGAIGGAPEYPVGEFHSIPCSRDVVADEEGVFPYDDFETMLQRNEIFAVSPCQCHYFNRDLGGVLYRGEPCEVPAIGDWDAIENYVACDGTHLEKCITFGEEAAYYIEIGIGKQLTRDEAREHLKRSVDEGCVLHSVSTKYSEIICCCSGPCLTIAAERAFSGTNPEFINQSNYNLMYDADVCLKCGTCAERCPLDAITMSEETGLPEVTAICIRCGQCAYVCPAEARKLVIKDAAEWPYLPNDLVDAINSETAWRMESGIYPYEV